MKTRLSAAQGLLKFMKSCMPVLQMHRSPPWPAPVIARLPRLSGICIFYCQGTNQAQQKAVDLV